MKDKTQYFEIQHNGCSTPSYSGYKIIRRKANGTFNGVYLGKDPWEIDPFTYAYCYGRRYRTRLGARRALKSYLRFLRLVVIIAEVSEAEDWRDTELNR